MADVGEELGLQFVELRQFLALPGNLALVGFLLGDVAAFGGDERHPAVLIFHRHERGVDDDGLFAAGASVDLGVPADELAIGGALDHLPQLGVDSVGDLPPEGGPEGFAFDVGELDTDGVERHLVDFQYGAMDVEQADELDHGVQGNARQLQAILFARVTVQGAIAANAELWCLGAQRESLPWFKVQGPQANRPARERWNRPGGRFEVMCQEFSE